MHARALLHTAQFTYVNLIFDLIFMYFENCTRSIWREQNRQQMRRTYVMNKQKFASISTVAAIRST